MSMIRRYIFLFILLSFCFTLCLSSYGARRRRSKSRSNRNDLAAIIDTTQNMSGVANQKIVAEENVPSQKEISSSRGKKQARKKQRIRRKKKNNPDNQPEGGAPAEEIKEKQEMTEPVIPQELQELDQRKSAQDEVSDEVKKNAHNNQNDTIEFYFENTDLQNVVAQIAQLYKVTFITDDIVTPLAAGAKALKGNKLSFKTHKPLTKKEGWNLFITFLDIAGFAIIPEPDSSMFRITTIDKAKRAAIPSYIGVDPTTLPDNDQLIRYVYFIENINPETLKGIVDQMLSGSAGPSFALRELKALIVTDKAYNIKMLMKIVKELDKVSMPQAMSVLKLIRADAEEVKKLYEAITKTDEQNVMARFFPARKQPTSLYFPENVKVIAESRTNSLILLGPRDAIEKIETFVQKYIDVEPDKPYSPLHTYQLQYADASTIATIMNDVSKFGAETAAGKVGGVRGGDKYFKPMLFIPESSTNQIIVRGDYDDYLKAVEIIKQLDEAQPQVAIEILVLTVELKSSKELGSQLRSKDTNRKGLFGGNVTFQAANLGGVITKGTQSEKVPGCQELLGNLLNLVKGLTAGNTVVSLGCDAFGVWGVFKVLETITNSEVISNPFLVAINKKEAKVSIGRIERLKTATIVGTTSENTFGDAEATLDVTITPQINSDGMIVLDLKIAIKEFLAGLSVDTAARSIREIDTKTIVADNEVIALGGLIRNRVTDSTAKTPLLGDIPLLGWLFKDRAKGEDKANLLVLVSTKIIAPGSEEDIKHFTKKHVDDYYGTLDQMYVLGQKKDPIHKLFFEERKEDVAKHVEDLLFKDKKKKRTKRRRHTRSNAVKTEPHETAKPYVPSLPIVLNKTKKNVHKVMQKKRRERQKVSLADLIDERVDDHGESLA